MPFCESKWPNDLEDQGQCLPFSIPAESIPGYMFGANLVILAQIYEELSCGQTKFPRILSQNGQNDLEGQGQWPPFSIPTESIPWCMFGANLVISAQICDDLSCGQGKVYGRMDGRTDWWTDGRTQATTIPLWPERPRGKNRYRWNWKSCSKHFHNHMVNTKLSSIIYNDLYIQWKLYNTVYHTIPDSDVGWPKVGPTYIAVWDDITYSVAMTSAGYCSDNGLTKDLSTLPSHEKKIIVLLTSSTEYTSSIWYIFCLMYTINHSNAGYMIVWKKK